MSNIRVGLRIRGNLYCRVSWRNAAGLAEQFVMHTITEQFVTHTHAEQFVTHTIHAEQFVTHTIHAAW
jgi:hypothetical protein